MGSKICVVMLMLLIVLVSWLCSVMANKVCGLNAPVAKENVSPYAQSPNILAFDVKITQ